MSHTLTGFGEAGSGSSLSEQLLQKISPQFRQWCWTEMSALYKRAGFANKKTQNIWGLTFRLEMENSFSHSLQWLASLSFNQT